VIAVFVSPLRARRFDIVVGKRCRLDSQDLEGRGSYPTQRVIEPSLDLDSIRELRGGLDRLLRLAAENPIFSGAKRLELATQ